jgi:hypothetical protein
VQVQAVAAVAVVLVPLVQQVHQLLVAQAEQVQPILLVDHQ